MWMETRAKKMSENDVLEMESVSDGDELDPDARLEMVDEEVGETHSPGLSPHMSSENVITCNK